MIEEIEALHKLVFFTTLVVLALAEQLRVFKRHTVQTDRRWVTNIALLIAGVAVVRVVLPVSVLAFSMRQPPGGFDALEMPFSVQVVAGFVFLDFWQYWAHRLYHTIPLLWRAHLVHHSDTQVDVTTSERHHPLEVVLGSVSIFAWTFLLGIPTEALGLYMVVGAVVALSSHANINLPTALEKYLRIVVVTPAVHAIHHSADKPQTDSNYAIVFSAWDRVFGTYSDPDRIEVKNFGLEYFHQPKDTGLLKVLLQPFLYRAGGIYPSREGFHAADPSGPGKGALDARTTLTGPWKRALWGAGAGVALAMLVLWPTFLTLAQAWQGTESYGYGWLVLPMVVYLLGWHFRGELLALRPVPSLLGGIFAVVAASCWGVAEILEIRVGQEIGLVLVLHAIVLSAVGWPIYKRVLPVLALLFLMVPNGDVLQPVLRRLTIESIGIFSTWVGLPHNIDGFSLIVGKLHYFVVDACSGLAHFNLTFFLGYCFGLMLFRSFFKVAAFALFAGALGILSNIIRVNAIVVVDWMNGTQMDLAGHGNIQWIGLGLAFGILFFVVMRLPPAPAPDVHETSGGDLSRHPDRFSILIPVAAGLAILVLGGTARYLPNNILRQPYGEKTEWLPQKVQDWTLTTPVVPWMLDSTNNSESISAVYRRESRTMQIVVIEALQSSGRISDAQLAPAEGSVWRDLRTQPVSYCLIDPCTRFLHTTWQRGKSQPKRHTYYAYSVGDFNTHSKLALRAENGWQRLRGGTSHPRLIGITFEGDEPAIADVAFFYHLIQMALQNRSN